MANKCFISKLEASVNNSSLPILKELRIKFYHLASPASGAHTLAINIYGATDVELKVVSGSGTFTVDGGTAVTQASIRGYHTIIGSNSDFDLSISDKYKIYSLSCQDVPSYGTIEKGWGIDISQFDYVYGLSTLVIPSNKNKGMFSVQNDELKLNLVKIQFTTVDFDSFNYDRTQYPNVPELTKVLTADTTSKGNIINFANYLKLNELTAYSANVNGEIDDLAAAQVALGRTSGSISFGLVDTRVTDGGNLITSAYIRSKGGTIRVVVTFNSGGYTKSYS